MIHSRLCPITTFVDRILFDVIVVTLFSHLVLFIASQIHHRQFIIIVFCMFNFNVILLFDVFHSIPNSSSSFVCIRCFVRIHWHCFPIRCVSLHPKFIFIVIVSCPFFHSQIMSIFPFSNHESSWVIYVVVIFYHSCSIANSITTAIHPISIRWLPFLVIVVHPIIDQILILAVTRISSISYLCFNPISVSHPKL